MKKKIILGAIFVTVLMCILPNINAVGYQKLEKDISVTENDVDVDELKTFLIVQINKLKEKDSSVYTKILVNLLPKIKSAESKDAYRAIPSRYKDVDINKLMDNVEEQINNLDKDNNECTTCNLNTVQFDPIICLFCGIFIILGDLFFVTIICIPLALVCWVFAFCLEQAGDCGFYP